MATTPPLACAVAAFAVLLAACSQQNGKSTSFGVTASVEQTNSGTSGDAIERSKSMTASSSSRQSVQAPAAPLILSSLSTIAPPSDTSSSMSRRLAAIVVSATTPIAGWPVDPLADRAGARRWAARAAATANTSNKVVQMLAESLSRTPVSTADETADAVLRAFAQLPHRQLLDEWAAERRSLEKELLVLDLSGAQVHFVVSGADYVAGAHGIVINKAGARWYGDGVVAGRRYEIAFDGSRSTSMSKQSSITDREETSSSSKTSGDASIR